ncbi:hypothetical protein GCM10010439_25230 [Actinocorallia aurantiaca]|uniref:Serine/threonine protein kinase n=1 Tax=Actinocorallia aurantiaca TaxID=46204 RepID=A0ABN3U6X0_9ACTN
MAGPGVPSVDTRRAVPPAPRPTAGGGGADTGATVTDLSRDVAFAPPAQAATRTATDLPAPVAGDKALTEQRLLDSPAAWAPPTGDAAAQPGGWNPGQTVVDLAARPSVASVPAAAQTPSTALEPLPAAPEPKKKRTLLYVALALVPTLAVAGAAYVLLTGSGGDEEIVRPAETPMVAQTPDAPAQSPTPEPTPGTSSTKPAAPSVDSAKTDPEPLTLSEIFPAKKLRLGGRDFVMDRKSLNLRCDYAANGSMARTLVKQKCQGLVRATYLTADKKIGVTVGVVAMPAKKVALAVQKSGTPLRKGNWFVALPGKNSKALAKTGGHPALDTYGRYVLYAYAQYLDGTKPAKQPKELGQAARSLIAYVNEPLKKR